MSRFAQTGRAGRLFGAVVVVVAAGMLFVSSGVSQAVADLIPYYVESFNDFTVCEEINGQFGWRAVPEQTLVEAGGAAGNRIGFSMTSMGAGSGFRRMAASPDFGSFPDPLSEDFVVTVVCGFHDNTTTWYVVPVNRSRNLVATRIKFDKSGALYVLVPDGVGGGTFELVPGFTWSRYVRYNLTLVFTKTGLFRLGINNRQVATFEASSFAVGVEAVQFESDNDRLSDKMLVDKIKARRGTIGQ